MRRNGHRYIDTTHEAQLKWTAHAQDVAFKTLYPQANSWYMGVNVHGKSKVFMPYIGGFNRYAGQCQRVVDQGYEGFVFAGN